MAEQPDKRVGLGDEPKEDWPIVRASVTGPEQAPIDRLRPNSKAHNKVREYLLARLESSEREMENFYSRWNVNELKIQAFISLPDWENDLKQLNESGEVPKVTRIVIPYSFATISTITTFLLHAFAGRKPLFQVGTYKDETMLRARDMEMKLQYDAEHTRLVRQLWQFLQDSQVYGLGIMLNLWEVEHAHRTKRPEASFLTSEQSLINRRTRVRELVTVYEGNRCAAIDPYMFYPDPNVPMSDVNKKGEFVFWRRFEGRHKLLRREGEGEVQWINHIDPHLKTENLAQTNRGLISAGRGIAGIRDTQIGSGPRDYVQVDQGTVEVIPKELGLSESGRVEKWLFSIANKDQIIQAEPFDTDHGMHPVAVTEPYGLGHGFGEPGMADYLAPLQDVVSWFFNSHIDNVRKSLNDMFVYDPSMIEQQDLKNPEPGKLIRLKRAAFGRDVRTAITQFDVQDVTREHINDANEIIRLGQLLSAVNDNILGVQDAGGRKTATEVRQSGEAAASRLAAQARIISAQGITDLTEMMVLNNQQFLSDEFFMRVIGRDAIERKITPDLLVGDFNYPIHDGTLPLDRVALLDAWKEIFGILVQDPELRQAFSIPRVFEHIAELGGARNIEGFRISVQPDNVVGALQGQGNVAAIGPGGELPGGGSIDQVRANRLNGGQELADQITSELGG